MLRYQRRVITRPVKNRIPIIRRLPTAQRVSKLPEHIARNARRAQRRSLPRPLSSWLVGGYAVLF